MKELNGLTGINDAYIATLAEKFLHSPDSLDADWRQAFEAMDRDTLIDLVDEESVAAWEARLQVRNGTHNVSNGHSAAPDPRALLGWQVADQVRLAWATAQLVEHYRRHGHKQANSNPLYPSPAGQLHVDYRQFGISDADLASPAQSDVPMPEGSTLGQLITVLEQTWCGNLGIEVMHIEDLAQRQWLLERIEGSRSQAKLDASGRKAVLAKLTEATLMEQFLGKKFLGKKRFSLEGGETLLPLLQEMLETSGDLEVDEVIMGMAHRGRLNVMVNLLHKEAEKLFAMFQDGDALENLGGGDVKYHLGQSHNLYTRNGNMMHVSLCFNPSHLEFVHPVVLGRARAKQEMLGDETGKRVLPIVIHGDSAMVGQGVVGESLNMMGLKGYQTGGALHVVVNNQIGFTTEPIDGRTTRYCTDIARWFECPVFHVNGESPESAVFAAQICSQFRATFAKDAIIDLICYRVHGHNENDEPRFTQPEMYDLIDQHKPPRDIYAAHLIATGVLTQEEDQAMIDEWTRNKEISLQESHAHTDKLRPESLTGAWKGYVGGRDKDVERVDTKVDAAKLTELLTKLSTPPEGFSMLRKMKRLMEQHIEMAKGTRELDWAAAEALAFATLLGEGSSVRISGQDSQRGTFSHRHAVMRDPKSYQVWTPLAEIPKEGTNFGVWNSPLSESAVLGYDYGYSLDRPEALTIWEAQFGDFVNGAQVIIDQFIASGEDKWARMSGLVMLLPHGFEGQGPEHSSARLERFLTMCAEDNMQVCNLTTPAQIFHVLRRQVLRPLRKPLIIMSPKSLLRHPRATSSLSELSEGSFQRIIGDQGKRDPKKVERVLICSGRLYFDLEQEREKRGADKTAIVRIEQLYPICPDEIREALSPYTKARFLWVQDEPRNMGAWTFIQAWLRKAMGRDFPVDVLSRAPSASPATGSHSSHEYEAKRLFEIAFGELERDDNGAVVESEV